MSKAVTYNPAQITDIQTQVFNLVESLLADQFYLVAVDFEKEAGRWFLRVYIEGKAEKISIEECGQISLLISDPIEEIPVLKDCNFILEVSSPGLFRTLKTEREWLFYQGQPVILNELDGQKLTQGLLERYDPDTQTLWIKEPKQTEATAYPTQSKLFTVILNSTIHLSD